jgi:hypothetical protein
MEIVGSVAPLTIPVIVADMYALAVANVLLVPAPNSRVISGVLLVVWFAIAIRVAGASGA